MNMASARNPSNFRLGVFMPVGSNGWILSKNATQYQPSYQMNKTSRRLAEEIGSTISFHGEMEWL